MITIFCLLFNLGLFQEIQLKNQLNFLYHTFCEALDAGKEVQAVFRGISKTFDRIWHTEFVI